MVAAAGLTSGLLVPSASADQISDLKAQAAAVEARINSLGLQEDALSEKYDGAQLQLTSLQNQVASAQRQLGAAEATTSKARSALKQDAIQAYMSGGSDPLANTNGVATANAGVLRSEYMSTLVTNQSEAIDRYHVAVLQEQAAETGLKQQQAAASAQLQQLAADKTAVMNASAQLSATYNHLNGQVAQLVAQQQAAEAAAAAAAAAAARRAAAAEAAAAAAQRAAAQRAVLQNTQPAVSVSATLPPPGSGASGAVSAAESRVGDWYQWGATGPNTFDCSGLVMWAYAQVGISLPHYSGAQYSDTTHIPMSALQPGDLVFFSDPGEHVAMYVGGGMIVEAAHTGTQVHVVPMYSDFVLASRVV